MKNRVFIVLAVLCMFSEQSFSQLTTKSSRAANIYFTARDLYIAREDHEAIKNLLRAISLDKNFIEAYLLLAEVYSENKYFDEAINTLNAAIAINPDFFPNTFYNIAYIYLQTGDYENSKKNFQIFVDRPDVAEQSRIKAREFIKRCDFAIHAKKHPVEFSPINLGDSINTIFDEYWPSLTADEETLVFTRQITIDTIGEKNLKNRREDFYISTKEKSVWLKASELGPPINTVGNEGAQSLSVDGLLMFFTACNREEGQGSCDIYTSVKEGGKWKHPVNIGTPVNSSFWEAQPSISPDGKRLYFVSNLPGGFGGMDLWESVKDENGFWSVPTNLGNTINTSGDEMSPFIHPDNKTLYFSSDGQIGMGAKDLFKATRCAELGWTKPLNLGYPVNTLRDETGLIVTASGKTAYFASDRFADAGKDIFMFELHKQARPLPVSYMKGIVFDAESKQRLGARFELIDLGNKETIMESFSDKITGEFLVILPSDRDYALNISRPEYLFFSENFPLKGIRSIKEPFLLDIPLKRIKLGETVVLRNIFFDFDSSELKPESIVELEKLGQFLRNNPNVKIRLNGHTDNIGSHEYNLILSEKRAAAVVNYLLSQNINKKRITFRGFGSTKPVDTNETPEGRANNRRIEFEVM